MQSNKAKIQDTSALSFTDIVKSYQHRVYSICYKFLRNKEDAEDLSQEVLVEIYRNLKEFRGDAKLSTWIYRIAVNKCMDNIRMKKRKKRNLFAFQSWGNNELERLQIPTNIHPQNLLENKEHEEIIHTAISKLPHRQKIAFTLAKIDGMKQDEIAQIMETTVSSIESLLIRAKGSLKKTLKDYFE